jgi:hypothetical protein
MRRLAEGRLQEQDRAPARQLRLAEGTEHRARIAIQRRERRGRRSKSSPVTARVGDEQDHPVDTAVTDLEGQSAFDRLNVGKNGLGFDAAAPAVAADQGIPCPSIRRSEARLP